MSIRDYKPELGAIRSYFEKNKDRLLWNSEQPWIVLSYNPSEPGRPEVMYVEDGLVQRIMDIKAGRGDIFMAYNYYQNKSNPENLSPDVLFIPRTSTA